MKNNEEVKKNTTKTNNSKKGTTSKNSSKSNSSKKTVTKSNSNPDSKKSVNKTSSTSKTKTSSSNAKKATPKKVSDVKKTENKDTKKHEETKKEVETAKITKETKLELTKGQETFVSKDELRKIAVVVAVIAVAFCVFFIASKLMDKDKNSDIFSKDLDVAEIQYKDILISKLFKQQQSEYYVLIEYSKDENLNTYEGYITNYETYYSNSNIYKIYTAQLDNAFNKSYYGETDSYDKNSLSFSQTTLVKISNEEIVETYTGNDISSKIQGLIGEASN